MPRYKRHSDDSVNDHDSGGGASVSGCADSLEYIFVCGAFWDCVFYDDDDCHLDENNDDNYSMFRHRRGLGDDGKRVGNDSSYGQVSDEIVTDDNYYMMHNDDNSIAGSAASHTLTASKQPSFHDRIRRWNAKRLANQERKKEERWLIKQRRQQQHREEKEGQWAINPYAYYYVDEDNDETEASVDDDPTSIFCG